MSITQSTDNDSGACLSQIRPWNWLRLTLSLHLFISHITILLLPLLVGCNARTSYTLYHFNYRIAGNFRGVKYLLFSWAGWPPVGVAYRNVGMPCSHETKRNFYSRKLPFLELNKFFTPRNLPAIRYHIYCKLGFKWLVTRLGFFYVDPALNISTWRSR